MDKNAFPKLTKQTLVDDFITYFEKVIISGELAIGEKLPSERELAASLGVSRPVVHEGLIDLAAKGLITRSSSGGAVINDYRKDGSLFMLNSLLRFNQGAIEPHLAESTMDFRLLVEVEFVRLAARHRTGEQLAEMKSILLEESTSDINDCNAIAHLDFRFHHLVAMATGNIFYPLLLNSCKELYLNGSCLFFTNPALTAQVFEFHKQLVGAIAAQDEEAAAGVMGDMLEHGKTNYMQMVSKQPSKE